MGPSLSNLTPETRSEMHQEVFGTAQGLDSPDELVREMDAAHTRASRWR
jgi:hypothetical protein